MPGEARGHRALEHDDRARLVDVEDRHAVDRRVADVARRGVRHVVGADDQRDVGARELAVDVVHLLELVVRDVGLGEQDVHVAGHAPRDRVDRVQDLDAAALELGGEVGDRALGLRDRHAVAGHDDDEPRVGELDRDVGRARRAHRAVDAVVAGAAAAPPPPPKPPKKTLPIERFIASAICLVRIEPDAPTSMPATISAVLSSAMPAAAALTGR